MKTQDAITKLREMQSQIVHGSNIFGNIADCLQESEAGSAAMREALEQYARPDFYYFLLSPMGQKNDPCAKAATALSTNAGRELLLELKSAKEAAGRPIFQCADCGNTSGFKGIIHPASPNGPEEHDIQCECGSLNVFESPKEAFIESENRFDTERADLLERLQKAEAERDAAKQDRARWVDSWEKDTAALRAAHLCAAHVGQMQEQCPVCEVERLNGNLGYETQH